MQVLWNLSIEKSIFRAGGKAYSPPLKIDEIIRIFTENIEPGKMALITIGDLNERTHATVLARLNDDIPDRQLYSDDGLYILEEQSCSFKTFNCDILPVRSWLDKLIFNVDPGTDILEKADSGIFGNVEGGNTYIGILNFYNRDGSIVLKDFPIDDVFYRRSEEGGAGDSKESSVYFGGVKRSRYKNLNKRVNNLNYKLSNLKTKLQETPNPEEKYEIEFNIDNLLKKINTIKKTISNRRQGRKKKTKKKKKNKKEKKIK